MNIKLILGLLLVCISTQIHGQENEIKPLKGDWGAEVNFSPFSSSPVSINYIRLRHFTDDKKAFRLGVFLGAEIQKPDTDPSNDEETTNQTFEVNIRPGFENHFEGTSRLSPYLGGELDFAYKFSKSKVEDDGSEQTIEGAWSPFGNERGFLRFGLNAIAGADYYVAKRLYLGVEFGFGFELIRQSDIKIKTGTFTIDEAEGGTSFQLGPNVNSALRLGFNF